MQLTKKTPDTNGNISEVLIQGVQTVLGGLALLIMSIIIVGQGVVIAGKLGEMLVNLTKLVFAG